MKKRLLSSVIWAGIIIIGFLIFVLQTSPGDRENFSQNPWAFVPFLFPWFLGVSGLIFIVATTLGSNAFSPFDLIAKARKRSQEQAENVRNMGVRIDELKAEAEFSIQDGTVISSETIPVTDIKGGFSGGGGQINSVGAGHTSGHIGSIYGSISSVTTLVSKFFVKCENAEYHIQLDSKDLQVREGSNVKIHWISHGDLMRMFKISNLDTGQQVVFEDAITKTYHDLAASKIQKGGNYDGIDVRHLLGRLTSKILADE
jgi:hypothetical protein